MNTALARILSIAWLALAAATPSSALDFLVTLRGASEAPANKSASVGVGNVTLNGNLLWYYVSANLWPPGGGIFGPRAPGAAGPVILQFTNYGFVPPWPGPGGEIVYGGYLQLTDQQVEDLKAGLWYIDLTSAAYPAGELRGQICALTHDGDCDNDGVPNTLDECPTTAPGAAVDTSGCSIEELIPCNAPWRDHKEYVKAFRDVAMRFWKDGRITVSQRNALIKEAEQSDCTAPAPTPLCDLHSAPYAIPPETTFWLHNGGIITINDASTYDATLNGIAQTGIYFWTPQGLNQTIELIPDDGSPVSTLGILVTDVIGCDERAGTYMIYEAGKSGEYTVTRPP